jgi:cell shape-determining protein MreC
MIVTITKETVYVAIIILLIILQVYQTKLINKAKKDIDDLWNQVQSLVLSIAAALDKLENKIDEKKDTK